MSGKGTCTRQWKPGGSRGPCPPEVAHAADVVAPLVLGEAEVGDLDAGRRVARVGDEGAIQQQVVRLQVEVHHLPNM